MTTWDTDRLAVLVEQKHDCLEQLFALSQRQSALLAADNLSGLLQVLAAKQRVLAQMQELEQQLEPYRRQSPDQRAWRCPELRQACSARIDACQQLLAAILENERRGEAELVRRRDEAAELLQGTHAARTAWGAYAASARRPAQPLEPPADV